MLKKIFYTGFLGWIFFYIFLYLKPELHFHTQQPAFLNTRYFFDQHLIYPGDLGKYISNFIMQGFYYNWLGSLIILFLAASLSFLLFLIVKRLNLIKSPVFLILPFALSILLFNDYYFPLEVLIESVFIFLSVYSIVRITHLHKFTIPYILFLYFELYYLFGSGTAIVFALSTLFVLYLSLPGKIFVRQGSAVIVLSALFPFIACTFIFNLSYTQAYFQFLPEVPVTQLYARSTLLYLFVFLLPIILFINLIVIKASGLKIALPDKFREIGSKRNGLVKQLVLYFFLTGFMLILMSITKNEHKRNIILSDFFCYQANWDKVIKIALADNEYDVGINLNYTRAIDNKGNFLEDFFDYPQLLGVSSIFPDNLKTPIYSMQISDFYLDINYISKSQHWAYALLTIEPYNARVLKRLVMTNLILGNYKASRTYLNVLSHGVVHSDFVDHFLPYTQDTSIIENDPYISRKRSLSPVNFAIPGKITNRLEDLILRDSSNRQAYEHLQMCYLLEHDLGRFMGIFDESVKFYNQIPPVYEQAVMLYLYTSGQSKSKIKLSDNSKAQFEFFLKTMKQCKNDKELAKSYLGSLKTTYIYYVTYLSPRVTNLKLETQ